MNGKQLVFLFMAATVVSVVIFLLGVLVGREVKAERTAIVHSEALNESPVPDVVPAAPAPAEVSAVPSGSDPTAAAPPPPVDDLSYPNRLEKQNQVSADLNAGARPRQEPEPVPARAEKPPVPEKPAPSAKPPSAKPPATEKVAVPAKTSGSEKLAASPAPPAPAPKEVAAVREPAPPASASASASASAGDGYAVQVAALNVRSEADAIAKRLTSKGYAAYVQVPPGTAAVFRVRVGTFKTRHEAETIAARLQKEEQIKPWVTR